MVLKSKHVLNFIFFCFVYLDIIHDLIINVESIWEKTPFVKTFDLWSSNGANLYESMSKMKCDNGQA